MLPGGGENGEGKRPRELTPAQKKGQLLRRRSHLQRARKVPLGEVERPPAGRPHSGLRRWCGPRRRAHRGRPLLLHPPAPAGGARGEGRCRARARWPGRQVRALLLQLRGGEGLRRGHGAPPGQLVAGRRGGGLARGAAAGGRAAESPAGRGFRGRSV
ncbi:hypothetical protein VUR80DRAFT_7971 [Thermomyces stellatus]